MSEYSDIKVSVIMPVYNARDYISNSVESVMKQTHENVEIILVDDCSTDGTIEVERKLAEKFQNIKVISNEENSGQTLSRNHGLEYASGEWFIFLDADDELNTVAIEEMLRVGLENNVDIVLCDYENIYDDGSRVKNTAKLTPGVYSAEEITKNLFINIPLSVYSCIGTKLYKTDFLAKKRRTKDYPRTGGDFMFFSDAVLSDARVYYANKIFYEYYVRKGSISNTYRKNMYDDLTETRKGLWELFEKYGISDLRKKELATLRYEIIYMSLYQETFKNRRYSDFISMYNRIFSSDEAMDAILYLSKHGDCIKKRLFMKMFNYPKCLYRLINIRRSFSI